MDLLLIILIASIAGFFAVRLYSVLGKREGHEGGFAEPNMDAARKSNAALAGPRPAFTGPGAAGLEAIRGADPGFDPAAFLDGAGKAYEMIVTAFADGDRETLENLLTPGVYKRWEAVITEREAAGRRQVSDLMRIVKSEIEGASLSGGIARIDVGFEADISAGQTDAQGDVIEGDPTRITRVTETWTFERPVPSDTPIWRLAKVTQV